MTDKQEGGVTTARPSKLARVRQELTAKRVIFCGALTLLGLKNGVSMINSWLSDAPLSQIQHYAADSLVGFSLALAGCWIVKSKSYAAQVIRRDLRLGREKLSPGARSALGLVGLRA